MGDFRGQDFAWPAAHLPECFPLPGGSDSRRVLAVTEPAACAQLHPERAE
ncbi:hypothetical protein [Streptomyces sp. NPDC000983]